MYSVLLKRKNIGPKSIIGDLFILDLFGEVVWSAVCVESAKHKVAAGTYPLRWTVSPRFTREAQAKNPNAPNVSTYEVCNVPRRSGIRVHVANFGYQLLGCIAPGLSVADIDKDGALDVTSSGKALEQFHALLDKKPTTITIQ